MPYPPKLVDPMRRELSDLGVQELLSASDVDAAMVAAGDKTALVVVNSVCGCAAANARPAVRLAMHAPVQPDHYLTVFAGQDLEATAKMRSYLQGIPPSSPFMALFKDGQPVFVLERRNIEGRSASAIGQDLAAAYEQFCGDGTEEAAPSETPGAANEADGETALPASFRSIL